MNLTTKQQNFLVAVLEEETIDKAIKSAGVSRSTAYKYLDDEDFKRELSMQRRRMVNGISNQLTQHGRKAVDTLAKNLNDPESTAANRNQAAKIILEFIYKNHEIENVIERLDAVEELIDNQK